MKSKNKLFTLTRDKDNNYKKTFNLTILYLTNKFS